MTQILSSPLDITRQADRSNILPSLPIIYSTSSRKSRRRCINGLFYPTERLFCASSLLRSPTLSMPRFSSCRLLLVPTLYPVQDRDRLRRRLHSSLQIALCRCVHVSRYWTVWSRKFELVILPLVSRVPSCLQMSAVSNVQAAS